MVPLEYLLGLHTLQKRIDSSVSDAVPTLKYVLMTIDL